MNMADKGKRVKMEDPVLFISKNHVEKCSILEIKKDKRGEKIAILSNHTQVYNRYNQDGDFKLVTLTRMDFRVMIWNEEAERIFNAYTAKINCNKLQKALENFSKHIDYSKEREVSIAKANKKITKLMELLVPKE